MAIDTPSDTVLDETPARALKFLSAASTNEYVWAALGRRGYSDEEHERGWQLLFKASGYRRPMGETAPKPRPEASAALAQIDAWDEPTFRIARAALAGDFPEQHAYLFQDLVPARGAEAILAVKTFLDRLDALQKGDPERKSTKKQDAAAITKLAGRGITEESRAQMRKLLALATAPIEAPKEPPVDTSAPARREAKLALWHWYNEWSEVARADIRRRDHLILLGLAKRKVRSKGEAADTKSAAEGK